MEINTATNQYIYLLAQDQVLHFSGPAGDTEVHIKNGEAWVAASACTNKLCIAMGHVSHNGDWVACLPNRIFLRIAAGSDQGIDAKTF